MDANVTLDVGKNVSGLIQQLANQIGVTADKVFPWYVNQAVLEGTTFFIVIGMVLVTILLMSGFIFMLAHIKKEDEILNFLGIPAIIFLLCLIAFCIDGQTNYTKIKNPQFHAMKMITTDIGKMVGK